VVRQRPFSGSRREVHRRLHLKAGLYGALDCDAPMQDQDARVGTVEQ